VRQFIGRVRFGQIEEIQIGCDADQHGLHEIESDQGVEVSGFVLRVKEHGHGQGHEPEAEQQIVDPGNERRRSQVVIYAKALRDEPERIGCSRETPERTC
jgi:hypothetical protein